MVSDISGDFIPCFDFDVSTTKNALFLKYCDISSNRCTYILGIFGYNAKTTSAKQLYFIGN